MDNCVTYPEALSRMENVYVDNWLESFDTEEEAKQACREMNELLTKCGFHLRRWATTVSGLLHGLPQQDLSDAMAHMPLAESPSESALGLVWDCRADVIYFSFRGTPPVEPTKREMLSCVARLFDPLGLLSPVIITARVLMQELWGTRCEWDEIPAEPLLKRWQQWIRNVRHIQHVTFPRCLRARLGHVSVHLFCDASESAYGAAAYVRSLDGNGQVNARLAFAKARVAPVRRLSILRLELLGAVIAVGIARLLIRELKVPKEEIWFWTDSNVVLWWLTSADKRFSVFVENRVTEILDGFRPSQWRHVAGTENPADDLLRGLKATALHPEHRWILGRHFLTRPVEEWPPTAVRAVDATESEEVRGVHRTILEEVSDPIASIIERISDLEQLLTTLTYVHRFVRRCRRIERQEVAEATEREWALHTCIRSVQRQSFPEELKLLQCGKELPRRSRFRRLFPFLDDSGLIRVGGRLAQADMDYEARHPPILPARHPLTTSLIRHVHARHCHSGVETTLNLARAQAWIVDGRAAVCRVLSECTICRRYRSNPPRPKVAPLPPSRLQKPAAPFSHVGIDFMGPFLVTCRRSELKRWICLFTCLAIRAVHMELCCSLDVNSFLSAFRRFIARRGPPSDCYSDNGTNFIAAARELVPKEQRPGTNKISTFMASRGIRWHFNPPSAPHFGGVWERPIRSAKLALRTTLHGQRINDEVLHTVIAEIEFILNCRPLTHVSVDPADPEPLTPNHFLLGRAYGHLPVDVISPDAGVSKRGWLAAQAIVDRFWKRWMREYVPTLAPGPNQNASRTSIDLGTVVLIVDPNQPRGQWLTGRVVRDFPGKDAITRVAEVKTKLGLRRRPLVKLLELCPVSREETGGGMLSPEESAKGNRKQHVVVSQALTRSNRSHARKARYLR